MPETVTSFQVQHEGRLYDVRYTVCQPCLIAEVSALVAAGQTERRYGAGEGAFTLSVAPAASAAPTANGTAA